ILQKYISREIIRSSTGHIRDAYDESTDALELLEDWEKDLMQITNRLFITKMTDSQALFDQVLADNDLLNSQEGAITGIPTGFTDLDKLTGGWQKTDMIVLAARPGMGKTALVLCH